MRLATRVAATSGDAGTKCPRRAARGSSPRRARCTAPARSPVSTRARAPRKLAQRRLLGQRLRGWGAGGAVGTGCPMETRPGEAGKRDSRLMRRTRALPAWGADSSLPAVSRSRMARGSASPRRLRAVPLSSQVSLSQQRGAQLRLAPRLPRGEPAQTLNFCGVQSLRRLRLPAAPALPPDARSPAVLVQLGIGFLSLGVSLGERNAAPAGAAGCETRAPRQGPGHPAPAQPAAREAAAGA